MSGESVGGSIVVGGRESLPHGEGSQGISARYTSSDRSPWESLVKQVTLAAVMKVDPIIASARMLIPGEPDAGKVARPVRRGV
jgi:hypothetical protein